MAEIINLNRFRKKQTRAAKDRQAEENRVKHGRSKGDRARKAADDRQREALLDGAKLTGDDAPDDKA